MREYKISYKFEVISFDKEKKKSSQMWALFCYNYINKINTN